VNLRSFAWLLVGVDFLDEWGSGVAFLGAPGIQSEFGVSYGMAAGWPHTALMLLGFALEPPLLLLADRWPRRPFVAGGLALLALLSLLAALAPAYWTLLAVLLLWGPASGIAINVAQGALIDAHPDERERWMTRWTLAGAAGDLFGPAVFAACATLGLGWRTAFAASGAATLAYALAVTRLRFPAPARAAAEDEPEPGLREALRTALRERRLLLWSAVGVLLVLLDEIVVSFAGLWLRDRFGLGDGARSLILGLTIAGSAAGLFAVDFALRRVEPLRLLLVISAAGCIAVPLWVAADSVVASVGWLFAIDMLAAGYYPIVAAQAYRALPGRPGAVNAVGSLFTPFELVVPLAVAAVADRFGLAPALLLFGLEPLGVFAATLWALRAERTKLARP
jgi:MFS family permease